MIVCRNVYFILAINKSARGKKKGEEMEVKKINDKIELQDVNGQGDCFNDCKITVWSGNRNSTDGGGKCKKKTTTNCSFTCDW